MSEQTLNEQKACGNCRFGIVAGLDSDIELVFIVCQARESGHCSHVLLDDHESCEQFTEQQP